MLSKPIYGPVAQLVRAPSLYLGGRWFESNRAYQSIMMYVSFLLFCVAAFFAFLGFKNGDRMSTNFALCLFMAAMGTAMVSFFSYISIQNL